MLLISGFVSPAGANPPLAVQTLLGPGCLKAKTDQAWNESFQDPGSDLVLDPEVDRVTQSVFNDYRSQGRPLPETTIASNPGLPPGAWAQGGEAHPSLQFKDVQVKPLAVSGRRAGASGTPKGVLEVLENGKPVKKIVRWVDSHNPAAETAARKTYVVAGLNEEMGLHTVPRARMAQINGYMAVLSDFAPGEPFPRTFNASIIHPDWLSEAQGFEFLSGQADGNLDGLFVEKIPGTSQFSIQSVDSNRALATGLPYRLAGTRYPFGYTLPKSYTPRFIEALRRLTPERIRAQFGAHLSEPELQALILRRDILLKDVALKQAAAPNAPTLRPHHRTLPPPAVAPRTPPPAPPPVIAPAAPQLNKGTLGHNVAQAHSQKFRDVLNAESIGGNAGESNAAVNLLIDAEGKIVEIGNDQHFSPDVRAKLDRSELREVTLRVRQSLVAPTSYAFAKNSGRNPVQEQQLKALEDLLNKSSGGSASAVKLPGAPPKAPPPPASAPAPAPAAPLKPHLDAHAMVQKVMQTPELQPHLVPGQTLPVADHLYGLPPKAPMAESDQLLASQGFRATGVKAQYQLQYKNGKKLTFTRESRPDAWWMVKHFREPLNQTTTHYKVYVGVPSEALAGELAEILDYAELQGAFAAKFGASPQDIERPDRFAVYFDDPAQAIAFARDMNKHLAQYAGESVPDFTYKFGPRVAIGTDIAQESQKARATQATTKAAQRCMKEPSRCQAIVCQEFAAVGMSASYLSDPLAKVLGKPTVSCPK